MRELGAQVTYYVGQMATGGWSFKLPMAALGGLYSTYIGGDASLLVILFFMIVFDLVFGTWAAIKGHRFIFKELSAWVTKIGTHFFVIFIFGVTVKSIVGPWSLDVARNLQDAILGLLIGMETLSILKSMVELKLPVPKIMLILLTDMQKAAENRAETLFKCDEDRKDSDHDHEHRR